MLLEPHMPCSTASIQHTAPMLECTHVNGQSDHTLADRCRDICFVCATAVCSHHGIMAAAFDLLFCI